MSGIASNTFVQSAAALGLVVGGGFLGHALHGGIEGESLKQRDRQVALKDSLASGELTPGEAAALPADARQLLDAKTPSLGAVRGATTVLTSLAGGAGVGVAILGVPISLLSNSPKTAMGIAAMGAACLGVAVGGLVAQFEPRAKA